MTENHNLHNLPQRSFEAIFMNEHTLPIETRIIPFQPKVDGTNRISPFIMVECGCGDRMIWLELFTPRSADTPQRQKQLDNDFVRRFVNEACWGKPLPDQNQNDYHNLESLKLNENTSTRRVNMVGIYELFKIYGRQAFGDPDKTGGEVHILKCPLPGTNSFLAGVFSDSYKAARDFVEKADIGMKSQCQSLGIKHYPAEIP